MTPGISANIQISKKSIYRAADRYILGVAWHTYYFKVKTDFIPHPLQTSCWVARSSTNSKSTPIYLIKQVNIKSPVYLFPFFTSAGSNRQHAKKRDEFSQSGGCTRGGKLLLSAGRVHPRVLLTGSPRLKDVHTLCSEAQFCLKILSTKSV